MLTTAEACAALLGEQSIAQALDRARRADIAFVGIGTPSARLVRGHPRGAGPLARGREGVLGRRPVGDIAARYFDARGTRRTGAVHDRVLAVSLDDLSDIPTVAGIAWGRVKVPGVLGGLRGRLLDVLICDESWRAGCSPMPTTRRTHDDRRLCCSAAVVGGWFVQLLLTHRQTTAFTNATRQLRTRGTVAIGTGGRRYRGGEAFVAIAVDPQGAVADAITLRGWTTFARPAAMPGLLRTAAVDALRRQRHRRTPRQRARRSPPGRHVDPGRPPRRPAVAPPQSRPRGRRRRRPWAEHAHARRRLEKGELTREPLPTDARPARRCVGRPPDPRRRQHDIARRLASSPRREPPDSLRPDRLLRCARRPPRSGSSGCSRKAASFFVGLVTGIIPLLIVLLTAVNALVRLIGVERIEQLGEAAARPGIVSGTRCVTWCSPFSRCSS